MRLLLFMFTLVFVFLTSCGQKDFNLNSYFKLKKAYCKSEGEICVIGIGDTKRESVLNAKTELAYEIYTLISSRFEKSVEVDGEDNLKSQKKLRVKTYTVLPLSQVDFVKTVKEGGKYLTVLKISKSRAKKLYRRIKNIITALSIVEKIEETESISLRVFLLKDLIKEVEAKNIWYEEILPEKSDRVYTFKSYIRLLVQEVVDSLKLINTPYGIYIVEKDSLYPVKDLDVVVKTKNGKKMFFRSDYEGLIRVKRYPVKVFLDIPEYAKFFGESGLYIDTVYVKSSPFVEIFIATNPEGLNFEIKDDYYVLKQGITPNSTEIRFKESRNYYLTLYGKDYKPVHLQLYLKKGYDYYVFKKLQKMKYGYLDVSVKGDALLTIVSADGRTIVEDADGFEGRVPVGRYKVLVKNKGNLEESQTVVDVIKVYENEKVERTYFEPEGRKFYREGKGGSIFLGFAGDGYEVKYSCTPSFFTSCSRKPSFELSVVGFMIKNFWTYTYAEGRLGFASLSKKNTSSSSSSPGLFASAEVGFYKGKETPVELGAGIMTLNSSYNGYSEEAKVSTTAPYLSFKVSVGGLFGVKVSYTLGKERFYMVVFDIGMYKFKEGYKNKSVIEAVKGIHYE